MDKKHLTQNERRRIAEMLAAGRPLSRIAEMLHVAHTTVAREILGHRQWQAGRDGAGHRALCLFAAKCDGRRCNPPEKDGGTAAAAAGKAVCGPGAPHFAEAMECGRLNRAPYVCNGCPSRAKCRLSKMWHDGAAADREYRGLLSSARRGADLNGLELDAIRQAVLRGLRLGQSLAHIMAGSPDAFPVSLRTLHRYVAGGLLPGVHRSDMPRAAGMKPRPRKAVDHKVDPHCRDGRGFDDCQAFVAANPDTPVVEIDSVLGTRQGRVLLTMHLNSCSLMPAFIRDASTSLSVIQALDRLEEALGPEAFRLLFPVLLADNGTEFSNPAAMERSRFSDRPRTRVFYCTPFHSWEKPHVENGNEYLRAVFPKGVPIPGVTQEAVNLVLSHVNSKLRPGLGGKCAIALFRMLYGERLLALLGLREIAPADVNLTASLLPPRDHPSAQDGGGAAGKP
jgi:IS30 family transposase